MGIFSKPQKKDELILVFNVGSSSVGGALFLAQKTGVPKIVFSVTESLRIDEKVEAGKLLRETAKCLELVSDKIHASGLGAPKNIFCILASPWYTSQTRIISFKKNTPFIFTEKLADELLQKEIKLFGEENRTMYPKGDSAVRPIELKNIKTVLNGYEAPNPLGQKVKELEMIIFISMSSESILKKFEEAIGKFFHFDAIKFSSFAMSSFTVVRDLYAKEENFLLMDIGGEVTEIFMTKKSVLRESISYPLGRNFLIRGVAANLGCTLDEAISLLSLLKDGHAESSVAKKLKLVIEKLKTEWLKNLEGSLAHLSKDISIPSTIYIIVDETMAEFFDEIIKSEQFSQYTLTESKFEITFLNTELLRAMTLFQGKVEHEPFLIMDSIYINRFLTKI